MYFKMLVGERNADLTGCIGPLTLTIVHSSVSPKVH